VTSSYDDGFADASWLLLLGAPRRTAGMERRDLLAATAASFATQGRAVQASARDEVRVLVVGNPANTNCLIARQAAPEVPDDCWFAMLRLDHNRAASLLADHAAIPLDDVKNVTVWGNHSPTMVPDAWHASIERRLTSQVVTESWMVDTFVPAIQHRGAQLIEVSGASSAGSAAAALTDSIHDITRGTWAGGWTTAGVVSHGEYGIPEGLQFGFPVAFSGGRPTVVEGLEIGASQRRLLDLTVAELEDERDLATQLVT